MKTIALAILLFSGAASMANDRFTTENQARLSDLRGSSPSLFSLRQGNSEFECKTWTNVSNDESVPLNIEPAIADAFKIEWTVKAGNAAMAVAQVDFLLRTSIQRKKSPKFKAVLDNDQYEIYCIIKE